jgi:hypothetical protein
VPVTAHDDNNAWPVMQDTANDMALLVEIIAVFISAENRENARTDHGDVVTDSAGRIALVKQAGSKRTGIIQDRDANSAESCRLVSPQ